MTQSVHYVHLRAGTEPPQQAWSAPFRAVVIAEGEVSPEWRTKVSAWLVNSGCLYMSAWGTDCSAWDTSVDIANIEACGYGEIPEDKFVMTTWHENESLAEAFWFAKNNAHHPTLNLQNTVLVHVAHSERRNELLASFTEA